MKRSLPVIFYLFLITEVIGQSYVLTNYTTRDGLAHNNIRDIDIDSTGFLWLSTWDGLSRYDGIEFRNYFHSPGDSTTIPYFSIRQIVIDGKNNLWALADNGQLCKFDRRNERFTTISRINDVNCSFISGLTDDRNGNLILLLRSGVLKFFPEEEKTILYIFDTKSSDILSSPGSFRYIDCDRADRVWIIGDLIREVELRSREEAGSESSVVVNQYNISSSADSLRPSVDFSLNYRFFNDNKGKIWIASNAGLFHLDSSGKTFTDYKGRLEDIKFKTSMPLSFYRPDDGLSVFFPGSDTLITVAREICKIPVKSLATGRNQFWFSGITDMGNYNGLTKGIIVKNNFELLNPYPGDPMGYYVYGISEDSFGGLWMTARDRRYITRITPDGKVEKINELSLDRHLRYWHPRALIPSKGGMWIGYFFDCMIYYDIALEKVTFQTTASRHFHTVCIDHKGIMYLADTRIWKYDPVTDKKEELARLSGDDNIFCLFQESDSILWGGASRSILFRLNVNNCKITSYKVCADSYNIEDICQTADGCLWLALLGGGVCSFDPVSGKSNFHTTAQGLSSNTTYGLLKDRHGNIWISTNNGISVIDSETFIIRTYGYNEGLSIHEFNSDAVYESNDGHFYFGGVGGAVRFDPEEVLKPGPEEAEKQVIIDDIKVSGETRFAVRPPYELDTIILKKGENNFHLSFVTLDFINPEKIKYRFRLTGKINERWTYTSSSNRNINYSNLKPGWYILDIESAGESGKWTAKKSLAIRVTPYFYQQKGFLILVPALIVLLITNLVYSYIRHLKIRERQKQDQLRLESLRGQMNPHFVFNSLNSINYFISKNDKLSANRYIADFSKLIRSILHNMQHDFIPLEKEIESVREYLNIEHLRFGDKFDYDLAVDEKIDIGATFVAPGLIQPFIENAIWHGVRGLDDRKGMITVRFGSSDGKIICFVEDDGIGRTKAESLKERNTGRPSRGIMIVNERLRIINNLSSRKYGFQVADLYPGEAEPGTRVIVEIPVKE